MTQPAPLLRFREPRRRMFTAKPLCTEFLNEVTRNGSAVAVVEKTAYSILLYWSPYILQILFWRHEQAEFALL